MLIGLKLDIGFSDDQVYRQLYGDREILAFLAAQGVEVVETPVWPDTEIPLLQDHIARCIEAGLKVSLHPYSEGTVFNPASFATHGDNPCRQLHERLLSVAAEAARLQRYPTVVNIHGAAGAPAASRPRLLDQSISFFAWARHWCGRHAPDVRVMVELQICPTPEEGRQRIADRYEELLDVAVRSDVGVCWDFGHAYWNTRRYGRPLLPPAPLVKRIAHVHCHDVNNGDHQPLVYGAVPWRDFVRLLIENGFDGRIILEVPPSEFLLAGGIGTLTASIEALRDWSRQCRATARRP